MSILRATAFFDAPNLFHRSKDAFDHQHANFDPLALHAAVCAAQGWAAHSVRYYTGVPSRQVMPDARSEWDRRLLSLTRQGVLCVTRPLRHTVLVAGEVITREKGIDVRVALDLVSTARQKAWDVAVVYSEDQDLAEAIADVWEIAREQSRRVELWSAFPENLRQVRYRQIKGTRPFVLSEALYNACLDPRDYRPKHLRGTT
jgi:uncharacterized LabA/DUF88 family protein